MGSYSRTAYMAIKKESTENVAVTPNVFIPFLSEDIVPEWGGTYSKAIVGSRNVAFRSIAHAIPAPEGTITFHVEPKTFGHFLRGVGGAITTGRYLPITSASGTFTVGETITGGTSGATATITAVSSEDDYLLTGAFTGTFTAGETITGGTSSVTATLTKAASTVYGHEVVMPQTSISDTYTVEFGLDNEAVRLTGVRFGEMKLNQAENVITAAVKTLARGFFRMGRVTAITASGSGAKTITVDQTTGLAASDSIKVYRPGTGFLDFSASGVKTHTVASIVGETSFTVTNLQTSLAVGDLIVLAPQTDTYSVEKEFVWAGGSTMKVSTSITAALAASVDNIEDYDMTITNNLEARHASVGANLINRFPAVVFTAGFDATGMLKRTYTDVTYLDKLRNQTQTGIQFLCTGQPISGATTFNYLLDLRISDARFENWESTIGEDELLPQDMPYRMYNSTTDGYTVKALLVNTDTAY